MLLWIINELSEMQLDISAMMIQLKVGGKTHEILEEQSNRQLQNRSVITSIYGL